MRTTRGILVTGARMLLEHIDLLERLKKLGQPEEAKVIDDRIKEIRIQIWDMTGAADRFKLSPAMKQWNKGTREALKAIEHVTYSKPGNPA